MTAATLPLALATLRESLEIRARAAVDAHYDGLWRFLRRMGVPAAHAEDAAQQVLLVFVRRSGDVEPGAERAFLFGTAVRVASDARRRAARERELATEASPEAQPHPGPDAARALEDLELRRRLDRALGDLHPELRAVLVLVDVEEMTMAEAAIALGIPPGTVASRLRRARQAMERALREGDDEVTR